MSDASLRQQLSTDKTGR